MGRKHYSTLWLQCLNVKRTSVFFRRWPVLVGLRHQVICFVFQIFWHFVFFSFNRVSIWIACLRCWVEMWPAHCGVQYSDHPTWAQQDWLEISSRQQGRRVKITAPVTDAAFVPVGHDLITASFSSNGFSASAPPQAAPRGRAESHLSAGWLFSSPLSPAKEQHFSPMAWRWWDGRTHTPSHSQPTSPLTSLMRLCNVYKEEAFCWCNHGGLDVEAAPGTVSTGFKRVFVWSADEPVSFGARCLILKKKGKQNMKVCLIGHVAISV